MSKNTQKNQPLIVIAIDFGGSSTKVVYQNQNGELSSLVMEPEVGTIPLKCVQNSDSKELLGSTSPENQAWVSIADTSSVQTVGYLAKSKYYAIAALEELKYEKGIYKTLAAIWVIKEKLCLSSKLQVALAVLLPPGEFEDKEEFERLLHIALKKYLTPTGEMRVKLKKFKCLPEGAGIYLMHEKKTGAALKQKICAIVMIGYRNTSVLIANRGMVENGRTSNLGMVRMVEKVIASTSGQNLETLTSAIALSGDEIDERVLRQLTRSKTNEGKAKEVCKLKNAIHNARSEYMSMLTLWLDNILPAEIDEIVFCGGTADYLMKELNQHFSKTPLCWNASVKVPTNIDTEGIGNRLCDVYSLFLYFRHILKRG